MVPSYEEVARIVSEVSLAGLPACHPWRALLEISELRFGIQVADGKVSVIDDLTINSSWDFSFSISAREWAEFRALPRSRGHTTSQALVATQGADRIRGSREVWARAAATLDRILDAIRAHGQPPAPGRPAPEPPPLGLSPIQGHYLHVEVASQVQRIYFETAGSGIPLVCLHTAGADSRQFRHLLEDPAITSGFQVIAFDLPWHGRSDPPDDWQRRRYTLTTETYSATVLAVLDALKLRRPVLLGCSMGGALALYLASRHGERFTGVCALEGGLGNPGRFVDWTYRADVDHSTFLTSWVGGLIAPDSPAGPRAQTLWGYAQSGPGVYQGDTYFYSVDLPRHAQDLGPARCPLYVFSGEYDYSATTEMSRQAARLLGGQLVEMPGRGHFPMSEDPVGFAEYLYPVLNQLRNAS